MCPINITDKRWPVRRITDDVVHAYPLAVAREVAEWLINQKCPKAYLRTVKLA